MYCMAESSKKEERSSLSRTIIDRTFVTARVKLSAMKFPARNLLAMLILFVERIITRCIAGNNSEHTTRVSNSSSSNIDSGTSLGLMEFEGTVSFYETATGATDFGGIYHHKPTALVNPATVQDIVKVVKMAASSPNLTVAARGNGHSINGQAQALNGVVLNMCSMKGIKICKGNYTQAPYVEAGAGELWVDVLKACLKAGLAPRSWTDYLFLSVGGTLSNGGVSGQTFKFGPQISNVSQLHIVSGTGEAITCSPEQSDDLFYGALGGLGQFGIITKARIMLQQAPDMVRWIRVVYSDFEDFRADQELLISLPEGKSFDYVEGFVLPNNSDPVNGWPCVPLSPSSSFDPQLIPDTAGPMLYCLEVALHYDHDTDFTEAVSVTMAVPRIKLGSEGFEVSAQGLGCMGMSAAYGPPKPEDEMISLIHHAVSRGITFLDTSDVYGPHTNELLLGKALKGIREKVQLATKFGIRFAGDKMDVRGDPAYVRACCEGSLKRLDVDCIDLYYQHRIDTTVPIEVTIGEMKKLVQEGKIKYIGLSEASASTIRRAHAVHPITAVQIEWSLWSRDVEEEIVPTCRELGIGIVPYSPLGRGFLSSGAKIVEGFANNDFRKILPRFSGENLERNKVIFEKLCAIASRKGCTPGQLALAWVQHQGSDVSPIPGTTKVKNLEENIDALFVKLSPDDIKEIEAIVSSGAVHGDRYSGSDYTWMKSETPPPSSWKGI